MGKLISGQGVHVPIYDFKKHQRSSDSFRQVSAQKNDVILFLVCQDFFLADVVLFAQVNASDVIILEGILVFHDQHVRDLMNMKIFVDTGLYLNDTTTLVI